MSNGPGDKPDPPHHDVPKLDYEPWPQRRKTPRALKVTIWVALVVHALGIIPIIAFFLYGLNDATAGDGWGNAISGGVCCIPVGALVLLGFLVMLSKVGDRDGS
jgi:hypothetical protein